MGEENQINSERSRSLYVNALYNPSNLSELERKSVFTVFEIGCGTNPPRTSWTFRSENQLWVGCDPWIDQKSGLTIPVLKPKTLNSELYFPGKYVVYNKNASEVSLTPDIFCAVAPNPKDIVEGNILNFEDFDNKLSTSKSQLFIAALETSTQEAYGYLHSAKIILKTTLSDLGFDLMDEKPDFKGSTFTVNSADAGAKIIKLAYMRNPSK